MYMFPWYNTLDFEQDVISLKSHLKQHCLITSKVIMTWLTEDTIILRD